MRRVFGGAHVGIFHGAFKGRGEQSLQWQIPLLTSILFCFLLSFVLDTKGKVIETTTLSSTI